MRYHEITSGYRENRARRREKAGTERKFKVTCSRGRWLNWGFQHSLKRQQEVRTTYIVFDDKDVNKNETVFHPWKQKLILLDVSPLLINPVRSVGGGKAVGRKGGEHREAAQRVTPPPTLPPLASLPNTSLSRETGPVTATTTVLLPVLKYLNRVFLPTPSW